MEQVKNIKLDGRECNTFYHVNAIFISVPCDPAINIIKNILEEDAKLHNRISITVGHIITMWNRYVGETLS